MEKIDYKKKYKELYLPKKTPSIIDVPKINYIIVSGEGNPNTSKDYKEAMEILYGLSFTIKMSKMKEETKIKDYFEYVVPPLEGLWWFKNGQTSILDVKNKDEFCWHSMIRQPEFVTREVFDWAKNELRKKKPELNLGKAKFKEYNEGLCVQVMHIGSYDDESETIEKMHSFIKEKGYTLDINDKRLHHEIYLSDPRRCKVDNLKTVIRYPVK